MRLSIVTPTIDSAHYIDDAVTGLLAAKETEIEHIIVHDGSEDYTRALAAKYPHLKILAGPGKGATPAVAIGNDAATGDFIICLPSDDRLDGAAVDALSRAARAQPNVRIWTGGTRIFRHDQDGREMTLRVLVSRDLTAASLANLFDDLPLVAARFIHRSVYAELGNIDPHFPISSDREFLIRAAMAGIADAPLNRITSEIRQHAGSRTTGGHLDIAIAYLLEHLDIADMWLSRPDISPSAKHDFRRWRTREVLRLSVYRARNGSIADAAKTLCQGIATDPLLPLWAPSSLAAWRRRRRSDPEPRVAPNAAASDA